MLLATGEQASVALMAMTLEEMGLEVTYPDRTEWKEAGSVVIDEYREKYPEFDSIMEKIEALQAEA